jgi:hypothetical protein
MIYLARHHQQGVFQHLASWDASLGALHRTRYITPNLREELLFCFGPYAYIWYDRNVPAEVAADVPLSFEFPEPEVGEFYLRDSFEQNGIVVGMKQGGLAVHAGGRAILVDLLGVADVNNPAEPVETTLSDDGRVGVLECNGPSTSGIGRQRVELRRPGSLSILRDTTEPISWWRHGRPDRIARWDSPGSVTRRDCQRRTGSTRRREDTLRRDGFRRPSPLCVRQSHCQSGRWQNRIGDTKGPSIRLKITAQIGFRNHVQATKNRGSV